MSLTRLAPSPTGALHLGNARTFLINWLMARRNGWKILLRIEDLDGPRVKSGADKLAMDDLTWLGLDWDGEPVYQSHRTALYQSAIDRLLALHLAYPCICTRREAELASSAPHAEDGSNVYPGVCRDRFASVAQARAESGREPAIRFRMPDRAISFEDQFAGLRSFSAAAPEAAKLGDFVIAKSDGSTAYQLAVVVDDADMNVTDVVRGDDLLDSAARQLMLYEALDMKEKAPRFWHLPLVIGRDGRRLAKRHGDTRLSFYRQLGVSPSRVLALLGRWCGMECGEEATLPELMSRFDIHRVSRDPIVFGPDEDAWLRKGI